MSLLAITSAPLAVDALAAEVARVSADAGEGCGAVTTFVGLVRATHKGRRVLHLEYEAFEPLALKAFAQIQAEVVAVWPDVALGMHHRVGRIEIGDASIAIVAASAHRAPSFEVCRYAIERVKQIAPIWKHEYFEGGTAAWVEGAIADPSDDGARQIARARACASA